MPRVFSPNARLKLGQTSADESVKVLLEITHPAMIQPARFINDNEDLVSNGNNFFASAFTTRLINDEQKRQPQAELSICNIGKELVDWIEQSQGAHNAQVKFMLVFRSSPNTIEYSVKLRMTDITVTGATISCILNKEDILNRPACQVYYDTIDACGLY